MKKDKAVYKAAEKIEKEALAILQQEGSNKKKNWLGLNYTHQSGLLWNREG